MDNTVEAALRAAHRLAWHWQHEFVTVEHLLLSWCRQGHWRCNESKQALEQELAAFVYAHNPQAAVFTGCTATLGLKRVIQRSQDLASLLPLGKSGQLLPLAICVERNSFAAYLLHRLGVVEELKNNRWGSDN